MQIRIRGICHYQMPLDVVQITQVSKVFLAVEKGAIADEHSNKYVT